MPRFEADDIDEWSIDSHKSVNRSDDEHLKENKNNSAQEMIDRVKELPLTVRDDIFNFAGSMRSQLQNGLKHIFLRDLVFHWYDVLQIILIALIVSGVTSFLFIVITSTSDIWNVYRFTSNEEVLLFLIVGLSMLFGGIFIDKYINKKFYYEILITSSVILMAIIGYTDMRIINLISTILLSIIAPLLFISLFTLILGKTSTLSRGRFVAFIVLFMTIFTMPSVLFLIEIQNLSYQWMIIGILGLILLIFSRKYKLIKDLKLYNREMKEREEKKSLSSFDILRLIKESKILPYLSFLFLIAMSLGFFLNSVIDRSTELNNQLIIAILIALLSFPLIGILMDNAGRKPIAIIAAFAAGIIGIFSDYPTINVEDQYQGLMGGIRIGIFTFVAITIVIYSVVIAGDKSKIGSRGKIMGLFLFATIGGVIIGVYLEKELFPNEMTQELQIMQADWGSAIILFAIVLFSTASESFDFRTTFWRHFLDRIYLLTNTGTAIYSYNFSKLYNENQVSEDLVSGGLTGIQTMLQEISYSREKIEVLHHGDTNIFFHHGEYTTAVLFAKRDLFVFKEKLSRFHKIFEYINRYELKNFKGNISKLTKLEELRIKYFE